MVLSTFLNFGQLHAQSQYLNEIDLAVGGTGQFTRMVPAQNSATDESTTEAAGALLSVREHPRVWAGLEENYQYSHFYDIYSSQTSTSTQLPVKMQEISAAYLIESQGRGFEPFIAIGGGALAFSSNGPYYLRPAGLLEAGIDLPNVNPHFGLRFEGRGLFYQGQLKANSNEKGPWLATVEPSLNFYVRF